MLLQIRRGLDLPIGGRPRQAIDAPKTAGYVALLGADYPGLKPDLRLDEGAPVKLGQSLFVDRVTRIHYVAPAAGVVSEITRGPRRTLRSVVIRVEGDDHIEFPAYSRAQLNTLASDVIRDTLLQAGLWTAFRTRPFNRNPDPATSPHSIFVTAINTEPLAADPAVVIAAHAEDFADGVDLVSRLFDVDTWVCVPAASTFTIPEKARIRVVRVTGPHPAGLVGTHIHHLDPVGLRKTVWHLDYQDVIAIGRLFREGRSDTMRIISLAGPSVLRPRLVPVTPGSAVDDILAGELCDGPVRMISGSVLSGRRAAGADRFLGRYHSQITALEEAADPASVSRPDRAPRFSSLGIFSRLRASTKYDFDTSVNGHKRPLIPFGQFERVMPLDILATPLLKSLLIHDAEAASALGCLELAEEDLALCEFVCVSKRSYASALRRCLGDIEAGRA